MGELTRAGACFLKDRAATDPLISFLSVGSPRPSVIWPTRPPSPPQTPLEAPSVLGSGTVLCSFRFLASLCRATELSASASFSPVRLLPLLCLARKFVRIESIDKHLVRLVHKRHIFSLHGEGPNKSQRGDKGRGTGQGEEPSRPHRPTNRHAALFPPPPAPPAAPARFSLAAVSHLDILYV